MHGKFTFLSGEICLLRIRVSMSVIMANSEAPGMATCRGNRQKSAKGIVGLMTEGPNVEVSGGLQ
jgi:hypothetical protein